jgi:hypothetical protein
VQGRAWRDRISFAWGSESRVTRGDSGYVARGCNQG